MNIKEPLDLKLTEIKYGKKIKYELELGREKHFASSKSGLLEEFGRALLKHPYSKVNVPELDERIYGKRFIHQIKIRAGLHNHPFWEEII